jgi:hypothetical protein
MATLPKTLANAQREVAALEEKRRESTAIRRAAFEALPRTLPSEPVQTAFPLQMDITSGNFIVNVPNGSTIPARLYSAPTITALKKDILTSSKIHSTYLASKEAHATASEKFATVAETYEAKRLAALEADRIRKLKLDIAGVPKILQPFSGAKINHPTVFNFNALSREYKHELSTKKQLNKAEVNKRRNMCGWKKNFLGSWYRARPAPTDPEEFLTIGCDEFEPKKRGGKSTRRLTNKMKMTRKRK